MGSTVSNRRRSLRDWLVDVTLFVFAVLFGLVLSAWRIQSAALLGPPWLFDVDQLTGVLACAALWLRRRWPVELAVALAAVSTYSEMSGGALVVALFTVAVHRGPRPAFAVYAASLVGATVFGVLRPEPDMPLPFLVLFAAVLNGAPVGWGLFIHHRRQLIASLRERAVRAETEARLRIEQAQLRAEQAQLRAREEIAREMHDVLGHRLSMLSVYAGALEFRPDASAEDVAQAAKVIRESAHQALQDLREVIGVLRAPVGELPQPTMADMPRLVSEAREAGMAVRFVEEREGTVPDGVGRAAYRIVQEALTNARKHAPGSEVAVRVAGKAGDGLSVEVRNTAPERSSRTNDGTGSGNGSGYGLAGLAERVALLGGRFAYGPAAGGGWRLSAWLPWPS